MQIELKDLATVIPVILVLGAILKGALPQLPNRFIPAITWLVGSLVYLVGSNEWTGQGVVTAILLSASATGIHSGIKNTFAKDSK